MKKVIFFLILLLVASATIFRLSQRQNPPQTEGIETVATKEPTATFTPVVFPQLLDDKTIQVAVIKVASSSSLSLYPNFKEKLSAVEVKKNKSCTSLTSAGFYDTQSNPLGLFISNGVSVRDDRPNNFFNGYFYLNPDNTFTISDTAPDFFPKIALQSGPILMLNRQPRKLTIIDDKPARRIIVGITRDDKLIFLALFNKDNNLDGPLLASVPNLLSEFSQKTNLNLQSALNLDGGSASAFYSDDVSLSELPLVGGFFCLK